jgi:hypothetical protein
MDTHKFSSLFAFFFTPLPLLLAGWLPLTLLVGHRNFFGAGIVVDDDPGT